LCGAAAVGRSGMLRAWSGDEGYCRSCGPCRPTCYSHRAWQAYLLESARISQASTGARIADSRRRAWRAGRFSCACLHPYSSLSLVDPSFMGCPAVLGRDAAPEVLIQDCQIAIIMCISMSICYNDTRLQLLQFCMYNLKDKCDWFEVSLWSADGTHEEVHARWLLG
jgi:hypothetical protein